LTQPDIFKNYILGSPTVNETIFKFESNAEKDLNANVYVSYGALETELGKNTEIFVATLKGRNYASLSLELEVIESSDHGRAFPKAAVHSMYWLSELDQK
jgi:predicted alpha/beta superfamily hydrolase